MDIGVVIAIIIAVGEFVAICFMAPMVKKQGKIENLLNDLDKKLMSKEEVKEQIDLKIYSHMNKCEGHKHPHQKEQEK